MSVNIAITLGDPAGVGPDVILGLAQRSWDVPIVVIGDSAVLSERAAQLNLSLVIRPYQQGTKQSLPPGEIYCLDIPTSVEVVPGRLDKGNAAYVLKTLQIAGEGCLKKEFSAVVTAPVHKGVINDAGVPFSGHTEFFAELAGVPRVVMMLLTEKLKVALATTHIPLHKVSSALTPECLRETLVIMQHDLKHYFGLEKPRIAVCGLNPHAGEGGHLGDEEITVIAPVLQTLRAQGLDLVGPMPADTIFTETADAILAMYHDQGLPVVKYSGFHHAVNMTLGLPFIRTSVDHGTALSLSGTGRAHPGSLIAATELAIRLAQHSQR